MDKKISQLTAATTPLTGAEELAIVQSGVTKKTTIEDVKGYKVYTALLTQSGGDNQVLLNNSDLTIGVTYFIDNNGGGTADFTNVGAPNNNVGTYFVATGTTPNSWGVGNSAEIFYNTGAPVVTVLENTIGNIWFTYNTTGQYFINSNNLFTTNKTWVSPNSILTAYFNGTAIFVLTPNSSTISLETAADDLLSPSASFFRIEIRVYN